MFQNWLIIRIHSFGHWAQPIAVIRWGMVIRKSSNGNLESEMTALDSFLEMVGVREEPPRSSLTKVKVCI